ncbi:MAG TPA: zinc-dependent peptidase [Flavobacteriales bacterium]|nr:zinc-dependent peptidase [Flavobacteriales bacterium]
MTHRQRELLAKYALPYQRLSTSARQRFEHKVSVFLNEKEWVGAGIDVAEEMKVMIGACAAQLLQGFPDVELKHFQRIVVYPDSYRSQRSGRLHQGEVRPSAGLIIISWDDFIHGYSLSKDAHNVGLHEMAHALWFENSIENGEDHFLRPVLLKEWCAMADTEIAKINSGEDRFFREYAGTNQAEFFAVAVEYFFERPSEFRTALPSLYGSMANLLKQDPAGS